MNGPLVVVGDALLDRDVVGRVDRVCPDAPVPVLDIDEQRSRPGGAALAAELAARDGRDVVLVTAIGADEAGDALRELLAGSVRVGPVRVGSVRVMAGLLPTGTPEKIRVRAGRQTLIRLDRGGVAGPVHLSAELLEAVGTAGALLVSDYGRGLSADPALRAALQARAREVPVLWDPHPRGAAPVPGARLVTPNEAEAALFDGAATETGLAGLTRRAHRLRETWAATAVAITLGGRGALLSLGADSPLLIPAQSCSGADACGAGDRFAATAVGLLMDGALVSEAVQGAVAAATAFVAAGGAGSVAAGPAGRVAAGAAGRVVVGSVRGSDQSPSPDTADLAAAVRAAGGTVVATGGCFDLLHAGHVATLQAARGLGDCLIVCLNSDASIRRLKGPDRPLVPVHDRARILAALDCVDAVAVFDEDTPASLLARLRPHVWVKGGDYADGCMPEAALLRDWGGQAIVVPYVEGRSSSRLARAAAAAAQAGPASPDTSRADEEGRRR